MTMPHLGNCPHKPGTWCLACVREEWERREAERDAARRELDEQKHGHACAMATLTEQLEAAERRCSELNESVFWHLMQKQAITDERDAALARVAELERERDEWKWASAKNGDAMIGYQTRAIVAESRLTAEVERLRDRCGRLVKLERARRDYESVLKSQPDDWQVLAELAQYQVNAKMAVDGNNDLGGAD